MNFLRTCRDVLQTEFAYNPFKWYLGSDITEQIEPVIPPPNYFKDSTAPVAYDENTDYSCIDALEIIAALDTSGESEEGVVTCDDLNRPEGVCFRDPDLIPYGYKARSPLRRLLNLIHIVLLFPFKVLASLIFTIIACMIFFDSFGAMIVFFFSFVNFLASTYFFLMIFHFVFDKVDIVYNKYLVPRK